MRLCPSCKTSYFLDGQLLLGMGLCLQLCSRDFGERCFYFIHPLVLTVHL